MLLQLSLHLHNLLILAAGTAQGRLRAFLSILQFVVFKIVLLKRGRAHTVDVIASGQHRGAPALMQGVSACHSLNLLPASLCLAYVPR